MQPPPHRPCRAAEPGGPLALARRLRAQPWWPAARRGAGLLFLLLVGVLMLKLAQRIDWGEAAGSVRGLPWPTLALAAVLAAASHALYGTYDLVGRQVSGHRLPVRSVLTVAFISYAFNLNLGSLIGGVAFRFRLYAQRGLPPAVITQVLALSVLSNWLGYFAVAGSVLLSARPWLPPDVLALPAYAQRVLGLLLLAGAAAYVLLCLRPRISRPGVPRPRWRRSLPDLPSGRLALLQLAVSATNWLLIGAIVFVLLQQRIEYATVLAVLLLAAVAGVVTHIPAGLGVLEGVFLLCLSHRLPAATLMGALLAYRVIYYLVPLGLASITWLATRAPRAGPDPRAASPR